MCVPCVSAIEIQTTRPISMKFGPQWGGRFIAGIQPHTPTPRVRGALNKVWRASATSTVRFGENFIKQEL
jgi:hypothetical protein